MILNHPLPKPQNKIAIEKYKNRMVYVYHGLYGRWLTALQNEHNVFGPKDKRESLTFKQALKRTKNYHAKSNIEYHFINSEVGEEKPKLTDFEPNVIYDGVANGLIKFDDQQTNFD